MADDSPKSTSEEKDYNTYLNKYFEIKNTYDEKQKKRNKNSNKCIKCGKAGGTIFSNKNNRYSAVCGAESPCSLHYELYRGYFSNSTNLLYNYSEMLESSKEIIIMIQNNDVFHFEQDELKAKFEKEKKHYETLTNLFTDLEKCLYDNDELNEKIKAKIASINKIIVEIRSVINDYKKSGNNEYIQSAIEQQKNVLLPLLEELQHLKYEIIEVDVNKLTTTTHYMKDGEDVAEKRNVMQSVLFQREVALNKQEINIKEPPVVVRW
jgi:hypothetical protein